MGGDAVLHTSKTADSPPSCFSRMFTSFSLGSVVSTARRTLSILQETVSSRFLILEILRADLWEMRELSCFLRPENSCENSASFPLYLPDKMVRTEEEDVVRQISGNRAIRLTETLVLVIDAIV